MGNFLQGIGDAHFGRVFKNDVPLERRGEYEARQIEAIEHLLFTKPTQIENLTKENFLRIQVGDWFDKPTVSMANILTSKKLLEKYTTTELGQGTYIPLYILSGNHDDSKNISDVTAWDLLESIIVSSQCSHVVRFVKNHSVKVMGNGEQILLVGWNITKNACQALLEAKQDGFENITTVVCHLDKISYGNDDNVIPYAFFAEHGVKMVISGHEHKPYYFHDSGMQVIGTGSLLPYSHAEDAGEEIYVTLNSINEFEEYSKQNDIYHKHIRLILDEDDQKRVDELKDVKSLSLKIVKKGVDLAVLDMSEIDAVNEVSIQAYDAKSVWASTVAETQLNPKIGANVWLEIETKGADE